eukprot:366209-Chlamydomonas_euryale.AAC.23
MQHRLSSQQIQESRVQGIGRLIDMHVPSAAGVRVSCREQTHKGHACVERSKTEGIKQQAGLETLNTIIWKG